MNHVDVPMIDVPMAMSRQTASAGWRAGTVVSRRSAESIGSWEDVPRGPAGFHASMLGGGIGVRLETSRAHFLVIPNYKSAKCWTRCVRIRMDVR